MLAIRWRCVYTFVLLLSGAFRLEAATIYVPAGGDLQKALNAAQPGDTLLLAENAEFVGNFVLPVKVGDQWITVRTAAPDSVLPEAGSRVQPSHAPLLARLRSPNSMAALRTAPGAHHWALRYLDFPATQGGVGDILQLGDGGSGQNSLARVPHHFVLSHVYIHGDPQVGQKRGIALNAAHVTIRDSYIAECKGIGQDTQAIGGWNGPGPYLFENNYLEAAGENVLFGGADPTIPNLVADGITFRRNYFSRPMAWRNPLVPTPSGVSASSEAGGALPAGSYAYRIVARRKVQSTTARSTASAEVSATTGDGGAVRIRWQPVAGTTEYLVYGRTPGAQTTYWIVTGTEMVDTGASGTSGAVPTSAGTVWSVKNIFELKNARNVVVEENLFENHWRESQSGYAIVLTPRNSQGTCNWCVVEHVRFERNIVRNVAAGINLLGYDGGNPSQQAADITFRQNLFTGLTTSLGGNAWLMLIGDAPRDVVLDHNTVDGNGTTVVYAYGGSASDPREIYGFRMIANAARHGTYGINGQSFTSGNAIIGAYFPGGVFERNYLAGGSVTKLPAGTLVTNYFQDQFVDTAAGDYTLRAGSILENAALDGSDIGVDYRELVLSLAGVREGQPALIGTQLPTGPAAAFTEACVFLNCTLTDASLQGTAAIASRTWAFGDGTAPVTGESLAHRFPQAGTYTITLTVVDGAGRSSFAEKTITVTAAAPPTAALTVACVALTCDFTDGSTAGSFPIASRSWSFGDGSAIDNGPASGTHVFALGGVYAITVTVTDGNGLSASASQSVTVEPPNLVPTAAFTASCVDLTCTFTDGSSDLDGAITGREWAFGAGTSTVTGPTFKFAAPGSYPVTLTVTDDDGATAAVTTVVNITGRLHAAYGGSTRKWSSASGATSYWSAEVTVSVHGLDERPIAGASVTAAWSGAVVKSATCITNASGLCTFKSGTLSYGRPTVTLKVSSVVSSAGAYISSESHTNAGVAASAVTLTRP